MAIKKKGKTYGKSSKSYGRFSGLFFRYDLKNRECPEKISKNDRN